MNAKRQAEVFVAEVGRKPSLSGKNDEGATDLHIAASLDLDMIALSFLKQGVDVNVKDDSGNTPLDYAS